MQSKIINIRLKNNKFGTAWLINTYLEPKNSPNTIQISNIKYVDTYRLPY